MIINHLKSLLIICILLLTATLYAQGLKRSGRKIVDQSGNEVILRGMGLGGWMLQEPYMMEMSGIASAQWEIKSKIQELIGTANTEAFYNAWHSNHCTKKDIDSLASWGFNSVRLPMHYNLFTLPIEEEPASGQNTWLDKGFIMTDSLIKWCSTHNMYVILDLHAAPGGQGKDYAICDGNPSKPSLWESADNRLKTIALWRKLAERYADEPWVGGYDLINEPNWSFTAGGNQNGCSETSNAPLRQLLIEITNAIREVDQDHMIIIEGNCWGNNYSGILPLWDINMALSFHKYWSYNDQNSIQGILNLRDQYNVPIWLGESGENSNVWFTEAIQLAENNNIGWAWWPLKKINSVVNPFTIVKTPEYQALLDYWKNGGTQPSATFATYTLMQMASNAKAEYCIFRKDVIDAMFRQVYDSTTRPFSANIIPGVIQSSDFDLGRHDKAYHDTEVENNGITTEWNKGWNYRNDGVDIETSMDSEPNSNGYNVGWTMDKEWMQYTTNVDSSAAYSLLIRYAASSSGSQISLKANEAFITGSLSLPSTGGTQNWNNILLNDIILYKGTRQLKIYFEKGGINLGFLKFTISGPISGVPLRAVSAETHRESQYIYGSFNKILQDSTVTANGFSFTINGNSVNITTIELNNDNHTQIIFTLSQQIYDGDMIKMSYADGDVKATDGTALEDFTDLVIKNNLPVHLAIPGKIEAEAFSFNQGLQVENTTDVGGGQNVGFTNEGDYLDYSVRIAKTGLYNMEVRIACLNKSGIIEVQQLNGYGAVINSFTLSIPVTGGWQTWKTINTEIQLTEGISTLRVKIIKPEFNMNWYKFTEKGLGTGDLDNDKKKVYPNPATNELIIELAGSAGQDKSVLFRTMNGTVVKKVSLPTNSDSQIINITDLPKGFYILEIEVSGILWRTKLIVQ
jgi:endoglucanase